MKLKTMQDINLAVHSCKVNKTELFMRFPSGIVYLVKKAYLNYGVLFVQTPKQAIAVELETTDFYAN
jgi:hypothetical protein